MLLIIIDFPYHSLSSLYHYPPACTGLPSLEAGLQMVHGGSRLLGQRIKKLSPIGSRILGSRICLGEFIFAQTREPRVCSVL